MPRSKKTTILNNPLEQISKISDGKNTKIRIDSKRIGASKNASKPKPQPNPKKTSTSVGKKKTANKDLSTNSPAIAPLITPKRGADEIKRDLFAISRIKKWSRIAGACALPPIPLLATATSSGAQISMIKDLCSIYDVPFHKELVRATIGSVLGSGTTLFSMGYLAKELLHGIPYAGNALLLITQPAAIYKLTSSLGAIFMRHFQNQGDLTNLDISESKLLLKNKMQ